MLESQIDVAMSMILDMSWISKIVLCALGKLIVSAKLRLCSLDLSYIHAHTDFLIDLETHPGYQGLEVTSS